MGMVWVARLANDLEVARLRRNPDTICDFVNSAEAYATGDTIDLEKHWHAIHFLLTGSSGATESPLSMILGNFEEVGPDYGYGPAWFAPRDVLQGFHAALSSLSQEDLAARYDPDAMVRAQVYIAHSLADEGEEGLKFLLEDIERLRAFAAKGAAGSMNAFGLIT
jgi:hypothetical protein